MCQKAKFEAVHIGSSVSFLVSFAVLLFFQESNVLLFRYFFDFDPREVFKWMRNAIPIIFHLSRAPDLNSGPHLSTRSIEIHILKTPHIIYVSLRVPPSSLTSPIFSVST